MARAVPSAQGSTSGMLFGAENTMNIERARVLAMADYIPAFRILTFFTNFFLFASDLS
jgi:hypothetical protein